MSESPSLDAWERSRYARHLLLSEVGEVGQQRLKAASVLCVGAGGLGSPVLLYLAAAGVGRIGIVDFDRVDESNLQRQIIHGSPAVGQLKASSARDRILEINPRCQVDLHPVRLSSANALEIVGSYDVLVDGTDNFPTRYLLNDAAVIANKPLVYGSIHKFEGQVSVFNLERSPHYRDLFPQPPPPGMVPSCAEAGVLGVLPGVVGSIQATEALKIILGTGQTLAGRLLLYDALQMSFQELSYGANPNTPEITELIDYEQFCSGGAAEGFERMSPQAIQEARAGGWRPQLIDVRSPEEAAVDRLDWTDMLIPHTQTAARLGEISRESDVLVYCQGGGRSAEAAATLAEAGWTRVVSMTGGLSRWRSEIETQSESIHEPADPNQTG
jgi:molybdopterin/thiamine biosynthesis adenylyltransferase/rhodanese-related sulfurtransferase